VTYLDANVIIRLVEGNPAVCGPIRKRLISETIFLTSQLSRLECRCHPLKTGNKALLDHYDQYIAGRELEILDINQRVIDEATHLRATLGFKSPDSIHLASAIVRGASVFLTGDAQLSRCQQITVEII
jgi:predicted nucleic acid-binding protein